MEPVAVTATLFGPLKLAAVPVPSAYALLPLPASVVTTPSGVTSLTRWAPSSATTITLLDGITATPLMPLKLAAVPRPSANVERPLPASVVTMPRGVMSRMRLLPRSLTTITPLDCITATPCGPAKLAAVPAPSAKALVPLPASVVTMRSNEMVETSRMRLLFVSATTTVPLDWITATPQGLEKVAIAAGPSAEPPLPVPAYVVTTPRGVTSRILALSRSATTILPLDAKTAPSCG